MGLTFVLEEVPATMGEGIAWLGGGALPTQLERFEWDADRQSAPEKPFSAPGEQRHKRTDNGAGVEPTFQILGPKLLPLTFRGKWDDRYNRDGFAREEKRRLKAVCFGGRRVRITYGDTDILGHIVAWDFPERMDWLVEYSFTVEVIKDDQIFSARVPRSPNTVPSPRQLVQALEDQLGALQDVQDAVPSGVAGTLAGDIQASLAQMADRVALAKASISKPLLTGPNLQHIGAIFRDSVSVAAIILTQLEEVRADTDLATRTAAAELAFEEWRRQMAFESRLAALVGIQGERSMAERANPNAMAIYLPRNGETLYEVSLNCYGTHRNATLIADHNDLHSWTLDGTEELSIPEAPQQG